jgi:hypothetical protein
MNLTGIEVIIATAALSDPPIRRLKSDCDRCCLAH